MREVCLDTTIKILSEVITVVLFVSGISLPLIWMIIPVDLGKLSKEKNIKSTLSPDQRFPLSPIKSFLISPKRYFEDNFGFRTILIRWHAILQYHWLKASTSSSVFIGKDSWLFYAGEKSIESLRCLSPYTDWQLAQWKRVLEARHDWLNKRGILYLVVIAPDKHTIYPEYIPTALSRVNRQSRLEQLVEYLNTNSTLNILDLSNPLKREKSSGLLYFQTDSHWNDLGAFEGYTAIGEQLKRWYTTFSVQPRSAFALTYQQGPGGDLAEMLVLQDVLHETVPHLVPKLPRRAQVTSPEAHMIATHCTTGEIPRAVILHDSFANRLIPFLSEHFTRALYWAEGTTTADRAFPQELLIQEQPTVVIQEFVERVLMQEPPPWVDYAEMADIRKSHK